MSKGPHYPLIQRTLPAWLRDTAGHRAQALRRAPLLQLPAFIHAGPQAELKRANAQTWTTQNAVDRRLKHLQDVYAFAQPLLTEEIKERYALTLDVTATHLFLHTAKGKIIQGTTSRTVSLLDAALHNFAHDETFTDSSSYITRPDVRGHFMIEPLKQDMSIEQFTRLCRELDLGARYQKHLRKHLLPNDTAAAKALQQEVIASQKAALENAAHLALLRQDIDLAAFAVVQRALHGERGVMQFYRLQMRDTYLTGILIIAPDLQKATQPAPLLVYIPNDRHGALQHYADSHAFMKALDEKLRDDGYRRFFSQFVDQAQRGHFFNPTTPRTTFGVLRIDADLWPDLYQQSLNKILNDARELAVSTALADSRARQAWWDNVNRVLADIFSAALLVVTPFVPLLGELTLAYTAYQLLDEVVEGVVDLAQGQALEAARHLLEVVDDVVQFAAFGVGGQLARSAFVDRLKAVDVNGRVRLWNPDPGPYQQQGLTLPAAAVADEHGLHMHAGKQLLALDGKWYAVQPDGAEGNYRIRHATRPDAYAPPLVRDDSPSAWSDQQLLRSLGPDNVAHAEQLLTLSGFNYATLRAAKTEQSPTPLLDHTLKRFELNQRAKQLPQHLRDGIGIDDDTYWSPQLARELPGWPADRAIDVYENPELTGDALRNGEDDATQVLKISRQDLNLGKLPERLVAFLDKAQLQALLGDSDPVQALRNRLAERFAEQHRAVFNYLYQNSELDLDTAALQVRQAVGDLPKTLARQVIAHARPNELDDTARHVPLRLRNLARELQVQARGVQGLEGFFEPALVNADTERMVLNTLRLHSDALLDTRLEIRSQSPTGPLQIHVGAADARRVRVLVRPNGKQHQLYDGQHRLLLRNAEFFEAVLHALPLDRQAALGFAPGQSEAFKAWMLEKIAAPEQRRELFESPDISPEATRDALVLTQKPMRRLAKWRSQLFTPTLEERVKTLYPFATREEIDTYLPSLEDPQQLQRFEAREVEKVELKTELRSWAELSTPGEPEGSAGRRHNLANALIRLWEHNFKPDPEGFGLGLNGASLQGLLGNLRLKARFDHVLHLELIDAQLLDSDTPFLENFPRLVTLNLQGSRLTRLPQPVTRMIGLRELTLDNNPLQWDAASLAQLRHLPWLRHLSLSGNRLLSVAPDIGGMPFLRSLALRNTGIREWPEGLFARSRLAGFTLDLQNTAIDHVPQFLPWQPEAELVARTRLDRHRLTLDAENTFVGYRLAAGLDPLRTYEPQGNAAFWLDGEKPDHQPFLQKLWNELEQEHGAQGFFEVLKSLEQPEVFEDPRDQLRYQRSRRDLTSKVWHMLIVMQGDEALRARLFMLASNPVTCADAGLQVFNAMGVEFELHDVLHTWSGTEQALQLARLAKGKSRLERLNQVAQADIRERLKPVAEGGQGLRFSTQMVDGQPGTVDEVEIYLAYQSALKQRLGLPWVSDHMSYRATADVDAARINAAHDSVLALEAGDGLVDGMLEQPFWDSYLRSAHADEFAAGIERANALIEPLDDLMFAQNEWASSSARSDTLKQRLLRLADALNVPHASVLSGEPMTPQTYERILADGFTGTQESERELARRLTREALQRLEAPANRRR